MHGVFSEWVCTVKAIELWFHSAHHLTKGAGFSGDHVNLYGKIYLELQEEFDAVAERVLGLPQDIRVDKNVPFNELADSR